MCMYACIILYMHTNVLLYYDAIININGAINSFPPSEQFVPWAIHNSFYPQHSCALGDTPLFASPTAQFVERPQPVFPDVASVRLSNSTCQTT